VVDQADEARQRAGQAAHGLIDQLQGKAQAVRSELLQEIALARQAGDAAYDQAALRKGAIGNRLTRFDELLADLCQQDAQQAAQQRAAWRAQTREEILESWFGAEQEWSWDLDTWLDRAQLGLDLGGLVPGWGEPLDLVNGIISAARGRWFDALLSFVAMAPIAGWGATGVKWARKADNVLDVLPHTDELARIAPRSGKHWTDFADEAARIRENAARSRGLDPNQRVLNMAIPRKKVLEKIAGYRKGIDFHLDDHIPALIGKADEELVHYWRKEVSARIREMEGWAGRLSKNDDILAEAAEYRRRLDEILDQRLRDLAD
jgi:hypothetical protein